MDLKRIIDVFLPWRKASEKDVDTGIKDAIDQPFIELPLQAYKVRRNMLLCSVLCAAQGYGVITKANPVIWGMNVELPVTLLNVCLLAISFYFAVYFSVLAWEVGDKWRFRRTGIPDEALRKTTSYLGETTSKDVYNSTAWEIVEEKTKEIISQLEKIIILIDGNGKKEEIFPSLVKEVKPILNDTGVIKEKLTNFIHVFWDSQSKRWKAFLWLEFHVPLAFWAGCWLWLVGRIIFNEFLKCPAVQ